MKKQLINWIPVLSPASFVAAVFMTAGGYFWPGSHLSVEKQVSMLSQQSIKGKAASLTRIGKRNKEYVGVLLS